MRTRKKLLRASAIVGYISASLYIILTSLLYSVGNLFYWLTLVIAGMTLYSSLYSLTIKEKLDDEKITGTLKTKYIINLVISILSPISFVLNLIALLHNKEDKYIEVINEEYVDNRKVCKKEKKWYQKTNFIVACIGLSTIIVSSFVAQMAETSFYSVTTKEFRLTKEMTDTYNAGEENALNGKNYTIESDALSYAVTEYKPKTASKENPLPVIFVMPGFTRTKATMSQYAIEFSKRGAVTFVIDPGSQGGTTYAGYDENDEMISSTVGANGLDYLVQYVYNNTEKYTYIDRERFGAVGHSAGGGNVGQLAQDFAGKTYEDSIIKAVYISGYIKNSLANRFKDFRCNAAMSYAYYDEGAFRYQGTISAFEVIARRFVNEVNGNNLGHSEAIMDYEYGSMEDGTYRVVHKEMTNHCFEMYDSISISNTINFFRRSLSLDTKLADTHQTWFIKEGFNGLALIGSFMFIFALLAFVIDIVPIFSSFKKAREESLAYEISQKIKYGYVDVPEETKKAFPMVKPQKKKFVDRVIFWSIVCISAIIACLDYIPLARLTMDWFPDAASNTYTFFFPARMMNAVMLWAVFNGIIGFILLLGTKAIENLIYKLLNKPENISWYRFKGMKVKPLDLLKSVGLAVVFFLLFYGVLQINYLVFHQDFRFMLISAAPLQPRMIVTWLIYLIPFFIFYLSNSLRVNLSMATEGWSEWKLNLFAGIANSIGLVFILVINYFTYFVNGTVLFGYYSPTDSSEMWLYVNMVFSIIPLMFVLPILNRYLYKKSGNIYLGALITVMLFIMMSISASVSYIPM